MSKSKTNKCRRVGWNAQPWFLKRRARNRKRDVMAKESRRRNRA